MKQMTCEQFFDKHFDSDFYDQVDDMYWEQSFSSSKLEKQMVEKASELGITLTDLETWDSDKFFWNAYKNTEKGLS